MTTESAIAGRERRALSRRYQALPDAAYCTDPRCRWQDPVSVTGITLDEHDDAVARLAGMHAALFGHEVRLFRAQVITLRPRAALTAEDEAALAHEEQAAAATVDRIMDVAAGADPLAIPANRIGEPAAAKAGAL